MTGIFKISKLGEDGRLSCFGFFGGSELDAAMADLYGKCGTLVVESSDGKCVQYGDDGDFWAVMRKWQK